MSGKLASFCGGVYLLAELGLGFAKRARRGETELKDGGSLRVLWIIIGISVFVAYRLAGSLPDLDFGPGATAVTRPLGLMVFTAGLALRWYAIVYLGRYFTVRSPATSGSSTRGLTATCGTRLTRGRWRRSWASGCSSTTRRPWA